MVGQVVLAQLLGETCEETNVSNSCFVPLIMAFFIRPWPIQQAGPRLSDLMGLGDWWPMPFRSYAATWTGRIYSPWQALTTSWHPVICHGIALQVQRFESAHRERNGDCTRGSSLYTTHAF
ncbi:hypothetical protein XENTR_v10010965 [Xenopus tropicalis]|nr:hypothetical protein XENTR_v10010965 [Xenopus tropicalis]